MASGKALSTRDADIQRTKLESLRHSLQLTDQIMSGRDDIVLRFSAERENGQNIHGYAITAGNVITVNVGAIPEPTSPSGIANILGLDYHELAHMWLTPADRNIILNNYKAKGVAAATSVSKNFWPAFGILEEARVETLAGTKYPSMRKYFAYPVLSLMVKKTDASNIYERHLLTHGRRFLPRKIRDTFREFFEKKYGVKAAREAEACIDKYRFLALTNGAQHQEAGDVIQRFARLLDDLNINPPEPHHSDGKGSNTQSQGSPNKNRNKSEARQEQQEMAKQAKEESDEQDAKEQEDPDYDGSNSGKQEEGEENDEGGSDSGNSGESSDGSDSQAGGGEGDESAESGSSEGSSGGSSGKGGGEDDQGDDDRIPSGDSKPGQSGKGQSEQPNSKSSNKPMPNGPTAGTGSGSVDQIRKDKPKPETYDSPYQISRAASEVADDLMDDEDFSEEIKRYQHTIDQSADGLKAMLKATPEKDPRHFREVTPEMFLRSQDVGNELRQIWAKMEAGWDYGVEDGPRLNMQNAAMATEPEDYETIYDDWSPGQQEASGLEVVIMGDRSGSMCDLAYPPGKPRSAMTWKERADIADKLPSLATKVSQNIWELMFALQEVDAKITVLTYDHDCYTFYERSETVTGNGWYELVPDGGTNPQEAFEEARRILAQSEMPNKLLVNFTDGGWGSDANKIKESLDAIPDVVKVAALLGNYTPENFAYRELFDVVQNTSGDILDIMSKAVYEIMQRSSDR